MHRIHNTPHPCPPFGPFFAISLDFDTNHYAVKDIDNSMVNKCVLKVLNLKFKHLLCPPSLKGI